LSDQAEKIKTAIKYLIRIIYTYKKIKH